MSIDVDALAQIIREVDGNHSLGAAALAEAIIARIPTPPAEASAQPDPIRDIKQALEGREGWHDLSAKVQRKGDTMLFAALSVTPPAEAQEWCPSCDGSGWMPGAIGGRSRATCPDCAGSGRGEHSITVNEAQVAGGGEDAMVERAMEAIKAVREWSPEIKDDYLRKVAIAALSAQPRPDASATQQHIDWLHGILRENGRCIDGGKCHHGCESRGECYRENGCVPLTGSRLTDKWELPTQPAPSTPERVDRYDAGLLSDFGGGDVNWWQDYIRAELDRAHDFYTEALSQQPAAVDGGNAVAKVVRITEMGPIVEWYSNQPTGTLLYAQPQGEGR